MPTPDDYKNYVQLSNRGSMPKPCTISKKPFTTRPLCIKGHFS
jgi:hypothetical protein